MNANNVIRAAFTAFVALLILIAVNGWIWLGAHLPAGPATAGRAVLLLSAAAGVVGVSAVWLRGRQSQ